LDLPLSDVVEAASFVSDPINKGALAEDFPELKYPTPHLSPTFLIDESVAQGPKVDSVEEEQDLSRVELAEHLNTLLVQDKRFFGPAR
jgi:hypothetical protein